MKIIYAFLAASVVLVSCNQYEKTKSGFAYKIQSGGSKEKLKQGQFVKLNIEYKIGAKDSVLSSTYGHIPAYIVIDTARLGKYNFTEIIPLCSVGDKVQFVMSVDTLKKLGMIPDYSTVFTKKGSIKGRVEILKAFTTEKDVNDDYMKEIDAEKQREMKEVDEYAKKNSAKTEKTPNGVLVQIDNAGTGAKIDSTKQASVYYKGYLFNGKVFDSNIKDGVKGQPFNVVVGRHGAIPGWEEGLKYFAKGGKGKLFIPSLMAYGMQGNPPVIPPFSNLVFEIEIADVTDAPPPPAQNTMNQQAIQEQIKRMQQAQSGKK